jgi:hypothetical protein
VQVTAAPFPRRPDQLFIRVVGSVIRGPTYFSWLFSNNFPFVYAYSIFTNSLHEGTVDFSVLLYTVTNLGKPCQPDSRDQPVASFLHILVYSPL